MFGPRLHSDGVTFRLWAPGAERVELICNGTNAMTRSADGWHQATLRGVGAGSRYTFRIDGGLVVPDPASAFQPDDVAGPSEVIDHSAYRWQCADWRGRPWHEVVFSEIHIGTFTPEGTFRAAIDHLEHLVETGITALEIMPVAEFPGARNWGYDGVLWYAPDSAYGRPDDLRALVDAAHARGLMVFLDVVYNHFGPEGNYLGGYAPPLFTERHHTPWGAAIDYRVPEVRAFAIESALHWLRHYRFDGLRLDAVHAIVEPGEPHVLEELSRAVDALSTESGRLLHLVLENDDNIATLLDPMAAGEAGKYRAQWNDDYHHAWHVLLTGETGGYYADFAEAPLAGIARALQSGFIYQGEPSPHRGGSKRGEPSDDVAPTAFVNFLQNHDQIGNRAYGERLAALAPAAGVEAALAVTLLAPQPPMLFMGEEWGATEPFPFFCDFTGDLAEAVRKGRKAEFEAAFAQLRDAEPIPDPLAEATFRSATLDWTRREAPPNAARLALVRNLLALRRECIVPRIAGIAAGQAQAVADGTLLAARWTLDDGARLLLCANLAAAPGHPSGGPAQEIVQAFADQGVRPLWGGAAQAEKPPATLPPWSVFWAIEES